MNRYLVWDEDETRDDAREMEAMSHWSAARLWAWEDDYESAEYSIANGSEAVVSVVDVATGEVVRFKVRGECESFYYANEVL